MNLINKLLGIDNSVFCIHSGTPVYKERGTMTPAHQIELYRYCEKCDVIKSTHGAVLNSKEAKIVKMNWHKNQNGNYVI